MVRCGVVGEGVPVVLGCSLRVVDGAVDRGGWLSGGGQPMPCGGRWEKGGHEGVAWAAARVLEEVNLGGWGMDAGRS